MVGGLFVNHLFAKAGLFWLAGHVGKERLRGLVGARRTTRRILLFGILLAAICGFPPFPGFWAKWQLVMSLAAGERYVWIADRAHRLAAGSGLPVPLVWRDRPFFGRDGDRARAATAT